MGETPLQLKLVMKSKAVHLHSPNQSKVRNTEEKTKRDKIQMKPERRENHLQGIIFKKADDLEFAVWYFQYSMMM